MAKNKLLPFATENEVSIPDGIYEFDTIRQKGMDIDNPLVSFGAVNKALKQTTSLANAIGKLIVDAIGEDATEADINKLASNIKAAIGGPTYLTQAEYDALEDPPNSGLYPTLAGTRNIIIDDHSIEYGYFVVPDSSMESAVTYLVQGGTHTPSATTPTSIELASHTAQETGFLKFWITLLRPLGLPVETELIVNRNNRQVFYDYRSFNDTDGHDSFTSVLHIIPVSAGDVIKFVLGSQYHMGTYTDIGIRIWTSPPKFVKKLAPVVIEDQDYSLSEIQLPTKWLNGKSIYRKCYTGTFTPSTGTSSGQNILDTLPNFGSFVAQGGNIITGHPSKHTRPLPYIGGDFAGTSYNFYALYFNKNDNSLYFVHRDAAVDTLEGSYQIWVEYTKTTD